MHLRLDLYWKSKYMCITKKRENGCMKTKTYAYESTSRSILKVKLYACSIHKDAMRYVLLRQNQHFSKVSCVTIVYSKLSSALTFEKFYHGMRHVLRCQRGCVCMSCLSVCLSVCVCQGDAAGRCCL